MYVLSVIELNFDMRYNINFMVFHCANWQVKMLLVICSSRRMFYGQISVSEIFFKPVELSWIIPSFGRVVLGL